MSTAAQTKLFGMRVGVDPKILVGGVFALVAMVMWFNLRSDSEQTTAVVTGVSRAQPSSSKSGARSRAALQRRPSAESTQDELKLTVIDINRSDVDPMLHYDLLGRLQAMPAPGKIRNLFQVVAVNASAQEIHGPTIMPEPLPIAQNVVASSIIPPAPPITLKFCGFIKSSDAATSKKGFFLDGNNVLIGAEGEVLDHRYLVQSLTLTSASLEDVENKTSQLLPLTVPETPK